MWYADRGGLAQGEAVNGPADVPGLDTKARLRGLLWALMHRVAN